MLKNLKAILETFDKIDTKAKSTKRSAVPENLFTLQEDFKKIYKEDSEQFHIIVAQLLFTTKRASPDIGTEVSFLTTRVRDPDQDDWLKLAHLIMYIRGTIDLTLTLSANGTGMLKLYVDGSYGVHPNMRGHSGFLLSMGTGFPTSSSTKHNLNTRSSTESDIFGVEDFMTSILWKRNFLNAQDDNVTENIIFQDKKSAVLLENNGKSSSVKRTKHINIRYFFVTDRIKEVEVTVDWCPTYDMTRDLFTKPNQG